MLCALEQKGSPCYRSSLSGAHSTMIGDRLFAGLFVLVKYDDVGVEYGVSVLNGVGSGTICYC